MQPSNAGSHIRPQQAGTGPRGKNHRPGWDAHDHHEPIGSNGHVFDQYIIPTVLPVLKNARRRLAMR